MAWLAIGRHAETGALAIEAYDTARAATGNGRKHVRAGVWRSFRVARVTASYERGAVRL